MALTPEQKAIADEMAGYAFEEARNATDGAPVSDDLRLDARRFARAAAERLLSVGFDFAPPPVEVVSDPDNPLSAPVEVAGIAWALHEAKEFIRVATLRRLPGNLASVEEERLAEARWGRRVVRDRNRV